MPSYSLSRVAPGHRDYPLLASIELDIRRRVPVDLEQALVDCIFQAVEFVLDPIRTGRTRIVQLDNVEKTFIGLKVEHFLRDILGAPKGLRDLVLAGHDVDVKNTVGESWAWMIPPETYGPEEPCILIAANEPRRRAWMGLIVARSSYLTAPNRDQKRGILRSSYENILWLVEDAPWPPNPWAEIDMPRFLELRRMRGGTTRATLFFQENLRKPIHRNVLLALLHDQKDPMKRLRENGGARDELQPMGIELLSGTYFNATLDLVGLPRILGDEFIAVDGRTPEEIELLRRAVIEAPVHGI